MNADPLLPSASVRVLGAAASVSLPGPKNLHASTDGGMGGVDEDDLGRPAAAVRKMRKVDRAGGGDRERCDGKCRHQELGALIDEPAQRDDGDREVGGEGEGAPRPRCRR